MKLSNIIQDHRTMLATNLKTSCDEPVLVFQSNYNKKQISVCLSFQYFLYSIAPGKATP